MGGSRHAPAVQACDSPDLPALDCGLTPGTRLMPVADCARDLPPVAGPAPDVNEAERAAVLFTSLVVAEPMGTDLHRPVVFDREDLETSSHELSAISCGLPEHLAKVPLRLRVVL